MNSVTLTFIAPERTWTYSKHISRDLYPASLLSCRSDHQKIQLPLLLRVGTCLQSCCLATRWSHPLQYEYVQLVSALYYSIRFTVDYLCVLFLGDGVKLWHRSDNKEDWKRTHEGSAWHRNLHNKWWGFLLNSERALHFKSLNLFWNGLLLR
jgi:hypothetical protein